MLHWQPEAGCEHCKQDLYLPIGVHQTATFAKGRKKGCLSPRTRLDDVHNAPLLAAAGKEGEGRRRREEGGGDLQLLPHNNKVLSQHSIACSDMHA